jgi:hypothetical protein
MTTLCKHIKRGLKQTSNKKVRPHEFQEGDFMPKKVILSNQTPGASGRLIMKVHVQKLLQLWMMTNTHVI